MARLATVGDLPSPAAALVMPTVCSWRSVEENCRFVARLRYASAAGECGSASMASAPPRAAGARDWPLRETVASAVLTAPAELREPREPSGGVDEELIADV